MPHGEVSSCPTTSSVTPLHQHARVRLEPIVISITERLEVPLELAPARRDDLCLRREDDKCFGPQPRVERVLRALAGSF
jgi:hypothetical protein